MSLFKNPQNPDSAPSEDRLREWGEAERTVSPIRRGRFAGVADRLTQGTKNAATKQSPWYRPAFVIGGVSLVAVSVAFTCLNTDPSRDKAPETAVSAPAITDTQTLSPSLVKASRYAASGWEEARFTRYDGGLSVGTDPVFINGETYGATTGYRRSAVVPFAVTLKNDGAAFTGEITVKVGNASNPDRTYTYPVTVAGNTTFRTTVYPEIIHDSTMDNNRRAYHIHLRAAGNNIQLDSGFVTIGSGRDTYTETHGNSVAILDERIGVLSPRRDDSYVLRRGGSYQTLYAKPGNAPERAIGYDAVDVLALGYGCEKLTPTQWSAIREWVKDGGSLILLGGSEEMRRVLATAAALDLSPAEQFATKTRSGMPRLQVSHFDTNPLMNGYFDRKSELTILLPDTLSTIVRAKPDARIIFRSPTRGETEWATIGARRPLGAGCVTFYGFDPTTTAFRDDAPTLGRWWGDVAQLNTGSLTARDMRDFAADRPWEKGLYENGPSPEQEKYVRGELARTMHRNPFITQLPDLKLVLYIFLGYFVLVIPVSFVVLKQTRRMQYAWFTGPLLAITFAGGLALFTRSLYEASQSLRTSGVLALEADDGTARFHGVTELYVPKGGRFSLNLPGTQRSFSGSDLYNYHGDDKGSGTLTPRITDDGTGEQPPTVDIPNLAFRRFYHAQTVTLGKGITVTFRSTHPSFGTGHLVGTLRNDTGLTIHNAGINMRGEKTVFRNGATRIPVWSWGGGILRPGETRIVLEPAELAKGTQLSNFRLTAASYPPCTPILTGRVSGEAFAPKHLGKWVGGKTSVRILVKLPAVPEERIPAYVLTPPPGAGGPPAGFAPPPPGFSGPTEPGDTER